MLPRLTETLSELRQDVEACNQGKLRTGLTTTVATIAVILSGWPPGDALQRMLFWVLVALPALAVGTGLIVNEMMHARTDRLGQQRADEREVAVLRARIAEEVRAARLRDGA